MDTKERTLELRSDARSDRRARRQKDHATLLCGLWVAVIVLVVAADLVK